MYTRLYHVNKSGSKKMYEFINLALRIRAGLRSARGNFAAEKSFVTFSCFYLFFFVRQFSKLHFTNKV